MADGVSYRDIQRPNYFNSQLLYESDFKDEQAYHRDMRLLHNRSLHTWGIVEGLDVQLGADNKSITVSRGMAIDNRGQEIVLAKDATPKDWPKLQLNQTDKDVYVTIRYNHVPDHNTKIKDILEAYSREKEIPTIEIADAPPAPHGSAIVLAKLKLKAGVITNLDKTLPTRSRSAGSVIDPAADLRLRSLLVEDKVGIGAPSPEAKLEVANHALDDTAFQALIRLLANQKDESPSNAFNETKPSYGIEFYRRWNNTINIQAGIYAWATGNLGSGLAFRTKPSSGSGATLPTRMVITDGGNVGVGTTAPKSTLSVMGGLAVGAGYAETNAAPANGLLVAGNVGIGTPAPGAKLEVAGEIKFSGKGLKTDALGLITPFYLRGTGLANSKARTLIIGSTKLYDAAEGRGLTLTIINKSNHEPVSTKTYDTFGSSDADGLATALNGIQNTHIGILTSYDAWEERISENLRTALRRVGLFKAAVSPTGNYRRPYAAIFEASSSSTVGTAKAVEVLYSAGSDAPYAEIRGWLVDGSFIATGSAANALTNNIGTDPVVMVTESGNVGIGTTDPGTNRLKVDGTLNVTGTSTLTGGVTVPEPSTLSFGETGRQMINLWKTNLGIGIQHDTQYFRTNKNFGWFKGGTHNGGELDAGGGAVQMVIKDGNVGVGTPAPGAKLEVAGEIKFSGKGLKTDALGLITPFYLRGTGLANSKARTLSIGSTKLYDAAEGRGLTLTIINKSDHEPVGSTKTYDTYGSSEAANGLATALNGITKDHIGILTSFDAWEWHMTPSLRKAFYRVGLYKAAATPADAQDQGGRRPYAAIFEASSSSKENTSKAIEVLYSNDGGAPFAEICGWLIDGSFIATGVLGGGSIPEQLDVIATSNQDKWDNKDHPIVKYFIEKLRGKPKGTLMRAYQDHKEWSGLYFQAWVSSPSQIKVIHNRHTAEPPTYDI